MNNFVPGPPPKRPPSRPVGNPGSANRPQHAVGGGSTAGGATASSSSSSAFSGGNQGGATSSSSSNYPPKRSPGNDVGMRDNYNQSQHSSSQQKHPPHQPQHASNMKYDNAQLPNSPPPDLQQLANLNPADPAIPASVVADAIERLAVEGFIKQSLALAMRSSDILSRVIQLVIPIMLSCETAKMRAELLPHVVSEQRDVMAVCCYEAFELDELTSGQYSTMLAWHGDLVEWEGMGTIMRALHLRSRERGFVPWIRD